MNKTVQIECHQCQKVNDRPLSKSDRKFCNRTCYRLYKEKSSLITNPQKTKKVQIICANCGEPKMIYRGKLREKNWCKHPCYIEYQMKNNLGAFGNVFIRPSGADNYLWLNDMASYSSIHKWVGRWKGKAVNPCSDCGITSSETRIQWSNESGMYLRDLNDYVERCQKCHRKHDEILGFTKKIYFNDKGHRILPPPQLFA